MQLNPRVSLKREIGRGRENTETLKVEIKIQSQSNSIHPQFEKIRTSIKF